MKGINSAKTVETGSRISLQVRRIDECPADHAEQVGTLDSAGTNLPSLQCGRGDAGGTDRRGTDDPGKDRNAFEFGRLNQYRSQAAATADMADRRRIQRESSEVRHTILEKNLGLVKLIVRKYLGYGVESDDLHSIAYLAALRAIDHYDLHRGYRFATYLGDVVGRDLWAALKRERRHRERSRAWGCEDPAATPIIDAQTEQPPALLARLLARLSPGDRELISMRYGLDGDDPMSQEEIGRLRGRHRSAISQQEARILKKMRLQAQLMGEI